MPLNDNNQKYKLAELKHFNYDLSKRWYVSFWAWDVSKEIYRRKRLFEPINRKKTVQERIIAANAIIATVNTQLRKGKVLGKNKFSNIAYIQKLTLLQAIDFVIKEKSANQNSSTYIRDFKILKSKISKWLEFEGMNDFLIKQLDSDDVFSFFAYVRDNVGSNKSFNNYRNNLSIVINFLMKRNKQLFRYNPVEDVSTLPAKTQRHAAYSDSQIVIIYNKCAEMDLDYLLVYIQFIYYTLARPIELHKLKVGAIDLENDRIFFSKDISKNRRDEYVTIPAPLKKLIIEWKICDYPKHYFVFGKNEPAEHAANKLFYYNRFVKVLKETGLDQLGEEYDIYSFKHSGAISLYLSTLDIKLVQFQCRHSTVAQTDVYLRKLGVMIDNTPVRNWQGAFPTTAT